MDSPQLPEEVELPHFLHFLVSTALCSDKGSPVCIILPSTEGIAQVISVLTSLECLAQDWDEICQEFVGEHLKPGVRVRTIPEGYVFEVGGRVEYAGTQLFALNYIDKRNRDANGRHLIPIRDALRYEPTLRKRPIGGAKHKLGQPRTTIVDNLAGVMTCGNSGLVRNRVVLVGSQAEFERALRDMHLMAPLGHTNMHPGTLDEILPRGSFGTGGTPIIAYPSGAGGQPMVAVTRDLLSLQVASLSKKCKPGSQIIVTDRVDLVLRNLDLAGRIAERQRFMLLAPADRREELDDLQRQGWTIWEPRPADLLPAERAVPEKISLPGIDRVHHSAIAERNPQIGWMKLESGALAGARSAVERLGELLIHEAAETDDRLQEILVSIRSLFFQATDWLEFPDAARIDKCLASLLRLLDEEQYLRRYVGDEAGLLLNKFVGAIDGYVASHSSGAPTPKGTKILDIAASGAGDANAKSVLVTGSRANREEADAFLERHGVALKCRLVRELAASGRLSSVIVFSVLRRELFAALVDPWPSRILNFVGYDFEIDLYRRRLDQRSRVRLARTLDAEGRTRVTGLPPSIFGGAEASAGTDAAPSSGSSLLDPKVVAFDRITGQREWRWSRRINLPQASPGDVTVEAKVVRFIGRSWMAVTEEHRLLALAEGPMPAKPVESQIQSVEFADLRPGLRLVVREGGGKDIIRLLAEQRVGGAKYANLKEVASLWREALRLGGASPTQVAEKLETVGVRRHPVTVRAWLSNDSLIGPRSDDDVMAIADAFPVGGKNERDWKFCCTAIRELRGLHLSAGTVLSELLAVRCGRILFEPSDTEIAVDLGMGLVWILEVGEADQVSVSVPIYSVNRLQWTDAGWRAHLMERRIRAGAT